MEARPSTSAKKRASEVEAVLACSAYALCSISLSLCNKLVFSGAEFNFPLAILAFQSLCAVVFLKGSDVLGLSKPLPLQAGEACAGAIRARPGCAGVRLTSQLACAPQASSA